MSPEEAAEKREQIVQDLIAKGWTREKAEGFLSMTAGALTKRFGPLRTDADR